MVSDEEIVTRITSIVQSADLSKLTIAAVRKQLEKDMGANLAEKKGFIREQVQLFLQAKPQEHIDLQTQQQHLQSQEYGVWLDEEGGVWLDTEQACDVKVCILPPHEQGKNTASTPSTVYAPSHLLCTIPYFQACLSEPWQKGNSPPSSSSQRQIVLECVDPSLPSDYRNCLLFLAPQEPVRMSVDVAIRLIRVADHLLYQECADVCMAYLASAPWSDKEEEGIDHAISSMGLKPSSDLAARLTSADDMKVFKEVITRLIEKAGSEEKSVAALRDFVNVTNNEASARAARVCMSVIREAWTSATNNLVTGVTRSITLWNTLTILILEYGDAERFLTDFIGCSKKLCTAMMWVRDRISLVEVLIQLFCRVIPGKADNKLVLLTNSQRASLLAAWAPMVADFKCKSLESAFRQLFTTLPLQDPVLVALVKEEMTNLCFGDCYAWWRTKLFKRMKRCDSVHEEIDLEASNSSTKRVKFVSGEES